LPSGIQNQPPSAGLKQRPPAPTKINNNLSSAIQAQSGEFSEVVDFLSNIKLDKYQEKFIDHGVEDLETILELQDTHVE